MRKRSENSDGNQRIIPYIQSKYSDNGRGLKLGAFTANYCTTEREDLDSLSFASQWKSCIQDNRVNFEYIDIGKSRKERNITRVVTWVIQSHTVYSEGGIVLKSWVIRCRMRYQVYTGSENVVSSNSAANLRFLDLCLALLMKRVDVLCEFFVVCYWDQFVQIQ